MFLETLATETEKASFTRIYELYCSTMYHYALGILKNKEDAEDALHDAFCRIIKVLPAPEDAESDEVRSYLYMTVRSVCFDALRRRRTAKEKGFKSLDDIDLVAVCDNGTDEKVFNMIMYEKAVEKLKELPVEITDPFVLRYMNGMPFAQIAKLLGISEAVARKRSSRVKRFLAAELKKNNR